MRASKTDMAPARRRSGSAPELDRVLESMTDGFVTFDREWRCTFANEAAARLVGLTVDRALGRVFWDVMPGAVGTEFHAQALRAIEDGQPRSFDGYQPACDRWFENHLYPSAEGLTIVFRDVTDRKRAEAERRRSEERLARAQEMAHLGSWELDLVTNTMTWSDEVYRILGLEPRQFDATSEAFLAHVHPDDRAAVDAAYSSSIREGRDSYEIEHRVIRAGTGEVRVVHEKCEHERDSTGRIVRSFGMVHDITKRTRAEAELRQAKDAVEEASRAKSQFLANMSHELRTPMNAILGMTELALEEELSPTVRDMLATAKDSADTLLELLDQILDLSRVEAGRLHLEQTEFCLREVVERTVKAMGLRAFQKGLELVTHVAADVPDALIGDPMRLRQVLANLVGNAIKFTHAGEVEVRVGLAPGPSPSGAGRGPAEVELEFSVRDTGIGISEADQARIFAPFTQADISTTRRYGGTGLGLAISRQIVDLMGGELWVDSRLGAGSTFSFAARFGTLPDICETTDLSAVARERLQGLRVLVIEENATSRAAIERLLAHWSLRPEAVADVPQALARLHEAASDGGGARDPFALVVVNGLLPGIDGFTLAQWLRDEPRLARGVVLMTSPADRPAAARRCEELGATFLEKPISQSSLLAAIAEALGFESGPVARAEEPAAPDDPPERLLRVLVADDTPAAQKLARFVLERRGHAVEVAPNGRCAVELASGGGFDAVLMDVQMPEMDGLQATAAIRGLDDPRKARVPIIAMTAHALQGDAERCLAAGMDAYIAKPIDTRELVRAVEARASPGPPPAPAFDRDEALRRCLGHEDVLREVVASYFDEAGPQLERARAALDRDDAAELAAAAHRLKNTVVYLAAGPATEASQRLVDLGRSRDLTEAAEALESLRHELRRLDEALVSLRP